MKVALELLRIIVVFSLLGAFGWVVIENIYTVNEITKNYSSLAILAILILLFVLYRNKLQFSGWYKGKARKKLSRNVSVVLILLSRSEEHTSELQSRGHLVCRLLLEKK